MLCLGDKATEAPAGTGLQLFRCPCTPVSKVVKQKDDGCWFLKHDANQIDQITVRLQKRFSLLDLRMQQNRIMVGLPLILTIPFVHDFVIEKMKCHNLLISCRCPWDLRSRACSVTLCHSVT